MSHLGAKKTFCKIFTIAALQCFIIVQNLKEILRVDPEKSRLQTYIKTNIHKYIHVHKDRYYSLKGFTIAC